MRILGWELIKYIEEMLFEIYGWELSKINDRCQTTDLRSLVNTKKHLHISFLNFLKTKDKEKPRSQQMGKRNIT
jgi:hypothetical protein